MSYFSQNLKLLRECYRYTQKQIANICDTTDSNISKYESGESEIKPYWKNKLAAVFDQKVEDMDSRLYTFEEAEDLAKFGARYIEIKDDNELEDSPVHYEKVTLPNAPAAWVLPEKKEEIAELDLAVHIGRIIDDVLKRNYVPVKTFAEKMNRSPRTIQRILKGEIMADPGMMISVCQDYNESLDIFRTKPMPTMMKIARQIADDIVKNSGRSRFRQVPGK